MMVHDAKCYTKRTPLLLAKRRLAIQCGNRNSTLCISYRIIQHIVVLSMTILNFPVRILLLWGFCHHYGTCRQDTLQRIQPFATFSRKLSGPPNGLRHYLEDSPNWNGGSIDAIDVNHGQSKWYTDNWIISNDNRLSIMTSNDWIMKMAAAPWKTRQRGQYRNDCLVLRGRAAFSPRSSAQVIEETETMVGWWCNGCKVPGCRWFTIIDM